MGAFWTTSTARNLWHNTIRQPRRDPTDQVVVNWALSPNDHQVTIPHRLGTANVFPILSANYNTTLYVMSISASNITVGLGTAAPRGGALTVRLVKAPFGGSTSVSSGSTGATISHGLGDSESPVLVTPSWNTAIYYTSRAASAITVRFGNSPGATGTLYYATVKHLDDYAETDISVSSGSVSQDITHALGVPFCDVLALPSWHTNIWVEDRLREDNKATLRFSVPPPAPATLDVFAGTATLL